MNVSMKTNFERVRLSKGWELRFFTDESIYNSPLSNQKIYLTSTHFWPNKCACGNIESRNKACYVVAEEDNHMLDRKVIICLDRKIIQVSRQEHNHLFGQNANQLAGQEDNQLAEQENCSTSTCCTGLLAVFRKS